MLLHYNLDKSFGPAGAFTGYLLIILGLNSLIFFHSLSGLVLLFLGSFTAFTKSGTSININDFTIKYSTILFGFIKLGKWQYINRRMQLGLSEAKISYRVRSMSNRFIDVNNKDFRIYLYNEDGLKRKAICRFKERFVAEKELIKLSDLLNIQIKE